jgi:hypothetical protein
MCVCVREREGVRERVGEVGFLSASAASAAYSTMLQIHVVSNV